MWVRRAGGGVGYWKGLGDGVCAGTTSDQADRRTQEIREFLTLTAALLELADWLRCERVSLVSMEATSDYWKPIYYLLEAEGFTCWLLNARHVKNVPGRPKTDKLDAVWLAKVTERGMCAPSLVHPKTDSATVEYHRAQIRRFLGFRECTVADAEKLAEEVCQRERRPERVREELLKRCREEGIKQPAAGRIGRIIGSGLRQAEKALVAKVAGRIPPEVTARMTALVAEASDDGDDEDDEDDEDTVLDGEKGRALLGQIRAAPGNVSLNTTREEIAKLTAIRSIGLPADVFADITPKVLTGWRDRAAMESPSHLREDHPEEIKLTLLAALLYCRGREITDTLVDLLIATVHRINARAERRVVGEFVADLKRVSGKENILFRISEAAAGDPDGVVRDVVFPAAGGVGTLLDLLAESMCR